MRDSRERRREGVLRPLARGDEGLGGVGSERLADDPLQVLGAGDDLADLDSALAQTVHGGGGVEDLLGGGELGDGAGAVAGVRQLDAVDAEGARSRHVLGRHGLREGGGARRREGEARRPCQKR